MIIDNTYTFKVFKEVIERYTKITGSEHGFVEMIANNLIYVIEHYDRKELLDELSEVMAKDSVAGEVEFILKILKIICIEHREQLSEAQKVEWNSMIKKCEIELKMLQLEENVCEGQC